MSSPDQPIGVALCGAGMISLAHATAARSLGHTVTAVASRSPQRAAEVASRFDARAVSYAELPAGAHVVAVATPPQCHADDAIRLLHAGAAVLLEKPLCRTLDEADRIVDAAARHHGRLLYGENLAYAPVVQRMVALAPRLGALTHLEVRALQSLPTWGDFTSDEWGGGALFDLGVHPLAVALLLANAAGHGRPAAVRAALRGGEGHGSDEHAEVWLRYRSGLVASVVASWQAGPEPMWDAQVAGDAGVLRAELIPAPMLEYNGDEVALPPVTGEVAALEQYGYSAQLAALVHDVAHGREPMMSAAFGREVLQVVMAAYTSAGRRGEEIVLPFSGPRDLTPLELWRRG
ncbi:MAG: Gfo/Idh/MocA family oxidoreductase [Actinomycetota bacterium]|nr:Gfo/Idh/MocA family oxidoreductase [Actinomycetota bacterium]